MRACVLGAFECNERVVQQPHRERKPTRLEAVSVVFLCQSVFGLFFPRYTVVEEFRLAGRLCLFIFTLI